MARQGATWSANDLPPPYPLPRTLAEWQQRREMTRRRLRRLLGTMPPRPRPVRAWVRRRRVERHYLREDLVLDNGAGAQVPAVLVLPHECRPPFPAVLWHHSHFGDYAIGLEELFQPWPVRDAPAAAFARRGFAV